VTIIMRNSCGTLILGILKANVTRFDSLKNVDYDLEVFICFTVKTLYTAWTKFRVILMMEAGCSHSYHCGLKD
jgi:hypothetical protein